MIKEILLGLLLSTMTLLLPIQGFIWIISLFVIADTILGIYTNVKLHGKSVFRSNRFFNIFIKSGVYMGCVVLGFLLDHFIMGTIFGIPYFIAKVITLLAVYTEIKSIDEKSIKLGNKSVWVMLKEMLKKGQELKKDLHDLTNTDKKD